LIALKLTHTRSAFQRPRLLALLGFRETAVILVSYINKLRLEGKNVVRPARSLVAPVCGRS